MNDDFDWDDDGMAPEGPPEELVHLALTCNGAWGLSIKDALQMREHMDGGKPPHGDSSWKHELEHHRAHSCIQMFTQLPAASHGQPIAKAFCMAKNWQGIDNPHIFRGKKVLQINNIRMYHVRMQECISLCPIVL